MTERVRLKKKSHRYSAVVYCIILQYAYSECTLHGHLQVQKLLFLHGVSFSLIHMLLKGQFGDDLTSLRHMLIRRDFQYILNNLRYLTHTVCQLFGSK